MSINPGLYIQKEDKPKPIDGGFWSDPSNVERFYHAYASIPEQDKQFIPQWYNPDVINEAHNYYSSLPENKNRDWWSYTKPENDEMESVLSQIPAPPKIYYILMSNTVPITRKQSLTTSLLPNN